MRISHTNKFIFFSNPKTGSESIREMLTPFSEVLDVSFKELSISNPFYSHITPLEVKILFDQMGYDFDSYTKIICTRNPFFKLVSLYEMIYRKWPVKPPFYSWLKSTSTKGKGGGGKDSDRWRKYGTYSLENLICDDQNNIIVDKILCLENIKQDLPTLFKDLNLPLSDDFKVIKKNVRKRSKKVSEYYTEKSINLVYKRYAWEINKFNYQFPEDK